MLHPGLKLGDRYRLDARIGAGGMGEVWRAVDEVLGRVVAVKAMLPEVADGADFARRFLVEAKAMASVNHPAVASIHDYGRSSEITFLVMEFIDGESLAQVLGRYGRLGPADTMHLIAQAADGLQAIHDCGIVHRDIKPANLLIRRNGSLLISDFGISRMRDGTHLTASGAVLGTPTYLSPEQVLGQPATALSDVYALGLTAYECLAGYRAFAGDNPYAVAMQRLHTAPRTISGNVPRQVLTVLEGALATDPAGRWPSAAAMAGAARAAANASAGAPAPATPPPAPPLPAGPPPAAPLPVPPAVAASLAGAPGHSPAPALAPARRRVSAVRTWSMVAALLVVVAVGGVAAWKLSGVGDGKGSDGSTAGVDPGRAGSAPSAALIQQAGFAACGATFCPSKPLCWGGLTAISGKPMPPGKVDCAKSHSWETFSASYLPADAVEVRQDELMDRDDIQTACSAAVMAARSTDPHATEGWVRDAWPVQPTGTSVWILHCMARPDGGDSTGSAFRSS